MDIVVLSAGIVGVLSTSKMMSCTYDMYNIEASLWSLVGETTYSEPVRRARPRRAMTTFGRINAHVIGMCRRGRLLNIKCNQWLTISQCSSGSSVAVV